ncbi:MAG: hypothetical protein QOE77_1954 [Blastocatellia bacterium]|jgi:hypothetical protein|nr:hypothetical protein [Blastocatellia bacterium]
MNLLKKRWPWISLAVLVSVTAIGYLGYRELDRRWQEMVQSKLVYTSPATVLRKSEGRVYYQIDNFDRLPEPRRSHASEAERKQSRDSAARSTYSVAWYDHVEPGSKIYVRYQCFSDGDLIIVGADTKDY